METTCCVKCWRWRITWKHYGQKREAQWILLLRSCLKQKKNGASVPCFRTKEAFPAPGAHSHTVSVLKPELPEFKALWVCWGFHDAASSEQSDSASQAAVDVLKVSVWVSDSFSSASPNRFSLTIDTLHWDSFLHSDSSVLCRSRNGGTLKSFYEDNHSCSVTFQAALTTKNSKHSHPGGLSFSPSTPVWHRTDGLLGVFAWFCCLFLPASSMRSTWKASDKVNFLLINLSVKCCTSVRIFRSSVTRETWVRSFLWHSFLLLEWVESHGTETGSASNHRWHKKNTLKQLLWKTDTLFDTMRVFWCK